MVLRFSPILSGAKLSDLFYCWRRVRTPSGESFEGCDPSEYFEFSWDERSYLDFAVARYRKPAGHITVSLRSREAFDYGIFQLYARLPNWINEENAPTLWFGFEVDDLFAGGVCHFSAKGVLRANCGLLSAVGEAPLEFLSLNSLTKNFAVFTVKVYRSGAVWSVNSSPVAFAVFNNSKSLVTAEAPFAVFFAPQPASRMPVLIDIDAGDVDTEWVWSGIHPWGIRASDGAPEGVVEVDVTPSAVKHGSDVVLHSVPVPVSTMMILDVLEDALAAVEYFIGGAWIELERLQLRRGQANIVEFTMQGSAARLRISGATTVRRAIARILF